MGNVEHRTTDDLVSGDMIRMGEGSNVVNIIVQYQDSAGIWDTYGGLWNPIVLELGGYVLVGNIFDGPVA